MAQIRLRTLLLLGLSCLSIATICVFFVDQALTVWLKTNNVGQFYRIIRTMTMAGESDVYFAVAILGALGAWLALRFSSLSETLRVRLESVRSWSLFFLLSLLSSGFLLHLIKFLVGRQRPHKTDDYQAHVFHPFNTHWDFHSFPSGHSQTLFTVATVVWITFPKTRLWVFPLAAILALTRVPLEAHFLSDVVMGAYIGFAVTLLTGFWLSRKKTVKSH